LQKNTVVVVEVVVAVAIIVEEVVAVVEVVVAVAIIVEEERLVAIATGEAVVIVVPVIWLHRLLLHQLLSKHVQMI
jgi:hypothetical protein